MIDKLRQMVAFFNSVDETLNDQITSFEQAEHVFDFAEKDRTYRHNNDVVRAALAE